MADYEAEFNHLVKFTPPGIWDSEGTKLQRFRDGLNLELQHDVQGFEMTTLEALVSNVKSMEEIRNKMRIQEDTQKSGSGKWPYGSFEPKKYEVGLSSGPSKRIAFERTPTAFFCQS